VAGIVGSNSATGVAHPYAKLITIKIDSAIVAFFTFNPFLYFNYITKIKITIGAATKLENISPLMSGKALPDAMGREIQ
jgi:hypothetical protein